MKKFLRQFSLAGLILILILQSCVAAFATADDSSAAGEDSVAPVTETAEAAADVSADSSASDTETASGSASAAVTASPAPTEGSICVNCPADGAYVRLWRIGSLSNSGTVSLSGSFSAYSSYINPNSTGAAVSLTNMATGVITPDQESMTMDGTVGFNGLKRGVYLMAIGEVSDGVTVTRCSPFIFSIPYNDHGTAAWNVQANAKYEIVNMPSSMSVRKVWATDSGCVRPTYIKVDLYCDGYYRTTVVLSKKNNWSYTWSVQPGEVNWTVREISIPSGYTLNISASSFVYTITNTGWDKPPKKLPQTGQLWWPVAPLACAGLALMTAGVIRRKRS